MNRNQANADLKKRALRFLEFPFNKRTFRRLVKCLAGVDPDRAENFEKQITRTELNHSTAINLVLQHFSQRDAISFTADCVEKVLNESQFDLPSAAELIAETREWISKRTTKKELSSFRDDVIQVSIDLEKKWSQSPLLNPCSVWQGNTERSRSFFGTNSPIQRGDCASAICRTIRAGEGRVEWSFSSMVRWCIFCTFRILGSGQMSCSTRKPESPQAGGWRTRLATASTSRFA